MPTTPCHGLICGSVMMFLVGVPSIALAQSPHLRTSDRYVSALVKAGAAHSETLRKLLSRLEASDVVAYVRIDGSLPNQLDGKTWFVSSAAGIRYVEIVLKPTGQTISTAALLAHELAHVIEIAVDAAIVDPQSMAERYLSTGVVRAGTTRPMVDTAFAVKTGATVQRELTPFFADLAAAVPRTR